MHRIYCIRLDTQDFSVYLTSLKLKNKYCNCSVVTSMIMQPKIIFLTEKAKETL